MFRSMIAGLIFTMVTFPAQAFIYETREVRGATIRINTLTGYECITRIPNKYNREHREQWIQEQLGLDFCSDYKRVERSKKPVEQEPSVVDNLLDYITPHHLRD